ncbi:MAG: hypothetical protein LBB45_02900 [Methanobrevibacter sp.]|jgi:hypothetical protein|nr:hypothetical protein [Candidatus Methanovirga basalitermitum]
MSALELIALLILIIAISVLIYYYLNDNTAVNKLTNSVPHSISNLRNFNTGGVNISEGSENISVGEKLKTKIKDIDMPNINTDAFSNRLDAFLNEKSEELIKDWELATKEDINTLKERFDLVNDDIGNIEKRFNEYKKFTNEKLDLLDGRLKKLEEDSK